MCNYFKTFVYQKSSKKLKKKLQLIRNTYYAANQRVFFTSKSLLTPGGKDQISNLNKSMIIYQFSCRVKQAISHKQQGI